MPWYANQTLTTFIAKIDRLNHFNQSFVPIFFSMSRISWWHLWHLPITLATCTVVDIWCSWIWDCQIKHIRICNWGRVLLLPPHTSVRPPFLNLSPSKNEVPPIPIHPNKITQHRILPVYWPSQQSTHISLILWLYVRHVGHRKLPRCCLDNANKMESMLPKIFNSRQWCEVWVCANDPVRVGPW